MTNYTDEQLGNILYHRGDYKYQNANMCRQLLRGDRMCSVIIDGNSHNKADPSKCYGCGHKYARDRDEKPLMCTKISGSIVTIAKCQELYSKIAYDSWYKGHAIKEVKISLSLYTSTEGNDYYDWAEDCLMRKDAYYYPQRNELIIYQDGMPIYANTDGVVCRDQAALCDTLFD